MEKKGKTNKTGESNSLTARIYIILATTKVVEQFRNHLKSLQAVLQDLKNIRIAKIFLV